MFLSDEFLKVTWMVISVSAPGDLSAALVKKKHSIMLWCYETMVVSCCLLYKSLKYNLLVVKTAICKDFLL